MVIQDQNLDALAIFQQKKYSHAMNHECMHGKVDSTTASRTFKILPAPPRGKTEKF